MALPSNDGPPRQQIADELRGELFVGRYKPGQWLPSPRVLAAKLGVSKNTVEAAYGLLVDEGFIKSVRWKGYVVLEQSAIDKARRRLLEHEIHDFQIRVTALGYSTSEIAAATEALKRNEYGH